LDQVLVEKEYAGAHFILITSSSEGFPLSLMEGMAHGCIPLATAVGDIPFHIKNGINGFTVEPFGNVAENMKKVLLEVISPGTVPEKVSASAVEYSRRVFNRSQFIDAYRRLFRIS
jgi:glycosyltransferase involved in cell wall biosynthesis